MKKDYPPAHTIHEARCPDAPPGLFVVPTRTLPETHPNSRAHTCISHDTVTHNRDVVAEPGDFEPHPYEPSKVLLPNATRPLCRTCSGTHSDPLGLAAEQRDGATA